MLHENSTIQETETVKEALEADDDIFRDCAFESASIEGGVFYGAFLSCQFKDVDWYSGLFNVASFFQCKFERCIFRGTSFSDCRFVECTFLDCQFLEDNLAAKCVAPGTKLYACIEQNCKGWNALFPSQGS
jgi:uncharacterized protein YjbI with pentapeptide repeats